MTLSIQTYRTAFKTVLTNIFDSTVVVDNDFSTDTVTKGVAFNIAQINQERLISGGFGIESIIFDCFAVGKTRAVCDELSNALINALQLLHNNSGFQRFYITDFSDLEFNPYEDTLYSNRIQVKAYINREPANGN